MTPSENPTPEPTPAYLSGGMGGFAPPLPEGSWERLQARQSKQNRRRRAALWWSAMLGLILIGLGGYGVSHFNDDSRLAQQTATR